MSVSYHLSQNGHAIICISSKVRGKVRDIGPHHRDPRPGADQEDNPEGRGQLPGPPHHRGRKRRHAVRKGTLLFER